MRKKLELELKASVIANFGGFVDRHEPARGAGLGSPDVEFLIRPGLGMLPVELKAATEIDATESTLYSAKSQGFRPSQIAWHREFAAAGGIAFGMLGVPIERTSFTIGRKHYKSFHLFITYGYEIGGNECLWRPISRHTLHQELLKHVAYLESDEGKRAWRSATPRREHVLPSGNLRKGSPS